MSSSRPLPVVSSGEGNGSPESQGWTRRFVASGRRLREAATLYGSLGLEVRLEPAEAPSGEACRACAPTLAESHVIYTRRPR